MYLPISFRFNHRVEAPLQVGNADDEEEPTGGVDRLSTKALRRDRGGREVPPLVRGAWEEPVERSGPAPTIFPHLVTCHDKD